MKVDIPLRVDDESHLIWHYHTDVQPFVYGGHSVLDLNFSIVLDLLFMQLKRTDHCFSIFYEDQLA